MTRTRDWKHNRDMWVRLLEEQTGQGLAYWKARIRKEAPADEKGLKSWLAGLGVRGYPKQLLVMERLGYPDFLTASADDLIDAQYADRRHLRPIYRAIVAAARQCGDIVVQARKGYVSLETGKRVFARVRATTKTRVDLGLRLQGVRADGRLRPSRMHETMPFQIELTHARELDSEAKQWLRRAYRDSA